MKICPTPYDTHKEQRHQKILAKNLAILVCGCRSHRPFQKPCLESFRKADYYTLWSYDNPIGRNRNPTLGPIQELMPASDVISIPDALVMRHNAHYDGGVMWPWIWHWKYGLSILDEFEFEYILCITDDCYLEKPAGISKLLEYMGDKDIFPYWQALDAARPQVATMAILMRTTVFRELQKIIERDAIINYKKVGHAEDRMGHAVRELQCTMPEFTNPDNYRLMPATYNGTWEDIVGLRHIHCEEHFRAVWRLFPLDIKYVDGRFLRGFPLIQKFWENRDINALMQYWKTRWPGAMPKYPSDIVREKVEKARNTQFKNIGEEIPNGFDTLSQ